MDNLPAASEAWKGHVVAAHIVGSTVAAIMEDLHSYGHGQATTEGIRAILNESGQLPKFTYLWYNWIMKATNGQNPAGIYPWNSCSSRFILRCKVNNDTNSTIFAKMRRRGYEIPGEHWVQVVLEEHQSIEDELARASDRHDYAALETIIVKAHDWGYTVPEISRRIFGSTARPASTINVNMVKMNLENSVIPQGQHRNGRKLAAVAQEFVLSAYNLGMDVSTIRDQLYVHGFNHADSQPIVDLLRENGIWQERNPEQAIPSQAAQPTQPRAREDDLPREEQVASRSARAHEEPGRSINVRDLLN